MLKELAQTVVPPIVTAIELIGVAVIATGATLTLAWFLYRLATRTPLDDAIAAFRSSLGRAILVGLEFLVAADIINTVVVELSLENVASLAIIVLIRTLLSFSLEAEIEGRWPWRRAADEKRS
jgi:uncharacterized membrane protein